MKRLLFFFFLPGVAIAILIACGRQQLAHVFLKTPNPRPVAIQFDSTLPSTSLAFAYTDAAQENYLTALRNEHGLQSLVHQNGLEMATILSVMDWTHRRWAHNGNNQPSSPDALTILREAKNGQNFRCVEYATVLTDALLALGFTARTVALKSRDAETCKTGAGHVLSEVFLKTEKRWVVVDAQFNVMPVRNGVPLNAVALQEAIVTKKSFNLQNANGNLPEKAKQQYLAFVAPYLFYFETAFDHRTRRDGPRLKQEGKTHLMLVPLGAKAPTVFQRKFPIDYCVYTNSLQAFYPASTELQAHKQRPATSRRTE